MNLEARIARIKVEPFLEALALVDPGFEIPERIPSHVCCPFHAEKTGSFYVQDHRWWCFGCSLGGDVLDYAVEHLQVGLLDAVAYVEAALGLVDSEDPEGLAVLAALARSRSVAPSKTNDAWAAEISEVDRQFLEQVRPYLRCRDSIVVDLALPWVEHVWSAIDDLGSTSPKTDRGSRDELRRLRRFADGHAAGIARDVERATGKDRLDVALQSTIFAPIPA